MLGDPERSLESLENPGQSFGIIEDPGSSMRDYQWDLYLLLIYTLLENSTNKIAIKAQGARTKLFRHHAVEDISLEIPLVLEK